VKFQPSTRRNNSQDMVVFNISLPVLSQIDSPMVFGVGVKSRPSTRIIRSLDIDFN
jgi:hypothetical protein